MIRRTMLVLLCAATLMIVLTTAGQVQAQAPQVQAQQAYGGQWGRSYATQDWNRFYHYPYVYYPQNFWGSDYYRSSPDLYNRYPKEMGVPTYNRHWQNSYPQARRYHKGNHFILDVF